MDRFISSIAVGCLLAVLTVLTLHFRAQAPAYQRPSSRTLAAQDTWQSDRAEIVAIRRNAVEQAQVNAAKPKPAPRPAATPVPATPAPYTASAAARRPAPPAPPAPPPPPIVPRSYNSIDDLIKSVFAPLGPGAVAWALRVADCESGDNPGAVNGPGGDYGLFQFTRSTFAGTPYGRGNIFDASTNARAAAWLYSRSGGGPWGCK